MANIIKTINSAIEKGETLVDKEGNTLTPVKVKNILKKEYQNGLKAETIDMEKTSFSMFEADRMKDYIKCDDILAIFQTPKLSNETEKKNEKTEVKVEAAEEESDN